MDSTNGAMAVSSFSHLFSMYGLDILTDIIIRNIETETRQESPNSKCQIPLILETSKI